MALVAEKAEGEGKKKRPRKHLTVKQEAFAQAYVETSIASDAYRKVYDCEASSERVVWVNACKLLKNNNVALRVDELKAKSAERNEVTLDYLTAEYRKTLSMAYRLENPSASVAALGGLAKLHGLNIEKINDKSAQAVVIQLMSFTDGSANDRPNTKQLEAKIIPKTALE
tara:strand:- start:229 stop:738 length:510 start_codon:yes stop_codon:yes gene_type:complete